MIVLIEGIGRCGKSTLALKLRACLDNFSYIHFSVPPTEDVAGFFRENIEACLDRGDTNLIIDRLHFSNYAYGTFFGPHILNDFEFAMLDQWLANMPHLCIMLCDHPASILERMRLTALEDPTKRVILDFETIGMIQNRFLQALDRSRLNPKGSYTLDQFIDAKTGLTTRQYQELLAYIRENSK